MNMNSHIERQKKYYDERWSQADFLNKLKMQRLNYILNSFKWIEIEKPEILDFGCGTGWLSSILNNIGPTTGIDLSCKAIDAAKKKHPSVNYVSGNVFEYPFEKESFDVVVSQEVIEHVEDQKRYLGLVANYLKKGSYLILTTPNAFNFNHWHKYQLALWNMQPIENWLTQKQLRVLLSPFFEILEMRTFVSGYGSKGIFRFVNSAKINKCLAFLRFKQLFDKIILNLGLGLHILVVAKRK